MPPMRCSACGCSTPATNGPSRHPARSSFTSRSVAFAAGSFVALTAISIVAKWLLIGQFEEGSDPDLELCLFPLLGRQDHDADLAGDGLHRHADLQRLSAPDGREDRPQAPSSSCRYGPVCADLLSIGDNTILRKDTIVLGYRAQSNFIHIGPVEIGANAFVGEASVLDIDTAMGDDTQLGHASSLQSGQRVPDGKRYHGSPAVETTSDYCPIESREVGTLRSAFVHRARARGAGPRRGAGCRSSPIHFWDQYATAAGIGVGVSALSLLGISAALFFGSIVAALVSVYAIPRLCMLFLKPGVTYPAFGFHYLMQSIILRVSNSQFFCVLFGDSIVHRDLHALGRLEPEQGRADRLEHGHQPAPRQSVPVQHRLRHDGLGRPVDDQHAHVGDVVPARRGEDRREQLPRQRHLLSAERQDRRERAARHQDHDPDRRPGARERRPARLARIRNPAHGRPRPRHERVVRRGDAPRPAAPEESLQPASPR